jgi:hypothetical protein
MIDVFKTAKTTYEDRTRAWLYPNTTKEQISIPLSNERLALVSLSYNGALGPSLKSAIESGNRAEAWYQIRYQSNGDKAGGIAKRRYYESEIFGLTDNDVSAEEFAQIKAMFSKNRSIIESYEAKYSSVIPDGDATYNGKDVTYKFDLKTLAEVAQDVTLKFSLSQTLASLTTQLSTWLKTVTDQMTAARTEASPLILDLDGDGIEVSALNSTGSVYWDVDNDGFREASSWVGKDDGLLALDINKNGIIDNHSELFGTLKTDGFTVLTGLDSNQNGMIDAGDTRFNDLRVWVDANSDGISQGSELKTLAQAGVAIISLDDTTTNQTINGNKVTHISSFTKTNGTTGTVADVWFNYDNVNSRADNTTPINPLTLFLPNLRGFGRLADLSIAMSKDAALLSKVQALTNAPLDTLFAPSFDLVGKMRDMLFTWAGVSGVAVNARGNYVNAQELGFLEALTDQSFTQRNYGNPYVEAGQTLTNAFQEAFQSLMARFLVQTIAKDLFTTAGFYNPATDQFGGTTFKANLTAIDAMVDRVMDSVANDNFEVVVKKKLAQ